MFLREDILDILSTARDLGFNLQLFSNLSVLSEKAIGFLSEANIEKISCTIFSLSPQVHDGITQCRGSLEATLRNILKLKARGVNVEIKNIIMRPNKDSYRELMAFCASHEIGYLGTTNVFPKHGDVAVDASLCIDDNDVGEILSVIDPSRAFEMPKSINYDSYICNAIHHSLYIDSSGDVFPCNLMLIKLGNIFDSTIGDLWNHSEILRSLSELRWRDLGMCKQCHCRFYCYRCAGIALASSGSLCLPDPIECKIAHSRWKNYSTERH